MSDRFDKFTERAKKVLVLAQEEAQRFNHNYIGTEHLLLGLVREGEGIAAKVLSNLGVELNKVRSAVEFIIGRGDRMVIGDISLTPRAKKVIELAVEEARQLGHDHVGTEHLLLGLVREGEGIAAGVLVSLGADLERVRIQVLQVVSQAGMDASGTPTAANRGMTAEELRAFLGGPWNAKVGCLAEDGSPYVVPAWYEWDGKDFWFVARARAAWATYIQRDPRVSLCIDQDTAPHARVQVQGRAEVVEEPNMGGKWVPIAERMATRYLGAVDGPRYLVPTLNRPRWLICVHPEKGTTWAGGGWHPRYLEA